MNDFKGTKVANLVLIGWDFCFARKQHGWGVEGGVAAYLFHVYRAVSSRRKRDAPKPSCRAYVQHNIESLFQWA